MAEIVTVPMLLVSISAPPEVGLKINCGPAPVNWTLNLNVALDSAVVLMGMVEGYLLPPGQSSEPRMYILFLAFVAPRNESMSAVASQLLPAALVITILVTSATEQGYAVLARKLPIVTPLLLSRLTPLPKLRMLNSTPLVVVNKLSRSQQESAVLSLPHEPLSLMKATDLKHIVTAEAELTPDAEQAVEGTAVEQSAQTVGDESTVSKKVEINVSNTFIVTPLRDCIGYRQ